MFKLELKEGQTMFKVLFAVAARAMSTGRKASTDIGFGNP
jgi:hypothetical protein